MTGPLGTTVEAEWRMAGETAVVESARASGLVLAGGAPNNDPVAATSRGTGELIVAAIGSGATGVDRRGRWLRHDRRRDSAPSRRSTKPVGSVTRGTRRLRRDRPVPRRRKDFGPQKGASPVQIEPSSTGSTNSRIYRDRRPDLADLPGAGAAGGLAGGLVVAGARSVPGFDLVADLVGLDSRIAGATTLITGEEPSTRPPGREGRRRRRLGVHAAAPEGLVRDRRADFARSLVRTILSRLLAGSWTCRMSSVPTGSRRSPRLCRTCHRIVLVREADDSAEKTRPFESRPEHLCRLRTQIGERSVAVDRTPRSTCAIESDPNMDATSISSAISTP